MQPGCKNKLFLLQVKYQPPYPYGMLAILVDWDEFAIEVLLIFQGRHISMGMTTQHEVDVA